MNKNHFHKYVKEKLGSEYVVYKCVTCPHYTTPELVIGNTAICNFCENTFIVTKKLRGARKRELRKKLHCGCRFKKKSSKGSFQTLDDILKDI